MAEVSGPFSSVNWNEDDWYKFAPMWATSGVLGAAGSTALNCAFSGRTATIQPGKAWVRGSGYELTAALSTGEAVVPANTHVSNPLIGRFVLQRSLAGNETKIVYKAGTPAASPTAPALTQVATGVWEEPLWSFTVPPASGTTITNIRDEREWTDDGGGARGLLKDASRSATDYTAPTTGIVMPTPQATLHISANRKVRVTAWGTCYTADAAPLATFALYRDGPGTDGYLKGGNCTIVLPSGGNGVTWRCQAIDTVPAGGPHTYRVEFRSVISGTVVSFATNDETTWITVEDLGPA